MESFHRISQTNTLLSFLFHFGSMMVPYRGLWVIEECLSIWELSYANYTLELWMMKDYKLPSSWTKTTLVLLINDGVPNFFPLCSTKSSDIIATTDGGYGLVKFNDKGQISEYRSVSFYIRTEVAMYTESLLSLPDDH
jgi:hypothetical protein